MKCISYLTMAAIIFGVAITSCNNDETKSKEFIVTFDTNGGTAVDAKTVKEGERVIKPVDPTRKGYTFAAWFKEEALATEWKFDTDVIIANITFHAKWIAISGDRDQCDVCGEEDCVCDSPCNVCDVCGEENCVCDSPCEVCDVCGEENCICDTCDVCHICGEGNCICDSPCDVCDVCGEEDCVCIDHGDNFYDLEYRIGIWVNPDRKDTLEFVNSSKLIRKGIPYKYEEYLYRVENSALIIEGGNVYTYHPILRSEKNIVHIGNMYIGPAIVGADNSGTFIKE